MKYRAEIDGLRAVAVVPVIFFHAGFELFSGGYVGVDVFFVISGYLITTILMEDIENNRFSIVGFYERRVRRILPALFFIMLVCVPYAWAWMYPSQLKDFSQSLIAVSLFGSNILFWYESGYFEAAAETKPLLHTWSLAVEEQYYVVFPVLLFIIWRYGRARVFWIIVSLSAISLVISEWGWRNMAEANFYLAPTRAWELFAGSIAAFLVQKRGIQASNLLSLMGLGAIVFAIFAFDEATPVPSVYALVPVTGVVLIVLFADKGTLVAKLLSTRLLVGVGLISYSAYLWHQPLFAFTRIRIAGEPAAWLMSLLALYSFLLAYLTWRYVEQPFRGKNALLSSRKSLFGAAMAGVIVFLLIGVYGIVGDQDLMRSHNRVLDGDIDHREFLGYIDDRYVDCEPGVIAGEALSMDGFLRCKQSVEGDSDWVLLGDSHAEHLFLGLAEAFPSKNIAFYISSAPVYLESEYYKTIFDVLLSSSKPKKIFLTMHYKVRLSEDDYDLSKSFGGIIEALQGVGHEVVLLGDIPAYDVHPRVCVYAKNDQEAEDICSIEKQVAIDQASQYHHVLTALSHQYAVEYYPIHDAFCDDEQCSMVSNGEILYRDTQHMNIPGSIMMGKYLSELMRH